jgi:hypothetical protein
MNFSFNAAASLVADDVRPRLFFGSDDIPSIRQGLNTVAGRKVWQLFVNRARTFAGVALAADDLPTMIAKWNTSWNNPGTQVVRSLVDIATLAVLDDDEQAFEVCRRILAVCPAAEEISLSSSQGRQRLGYSTGFYLSPASAMAISLMYTFSCRSSPVIKTALMLTVSKKFLKISAVPTPSPIAALITPVRWRKR